MQKILKRLTKNLTYLLVIIGVSFQPAIVARAADLENLIGNSIPYYIPGDSCGASAALSGPAAEILAKQTNLDPKWITLIVGSAQTAGADPLAMASLLFWEHRGFPVYGQGPQPGESDNGGRGPWQIVKATWPSSAGAYMSGVYDPVTSTKVAAQIVKNYGGVAGIPIGSIEQDFGKGVEIKSMALVAKNYNAGHATWRSPSVATYSQFGRQWMEGTRGPWFFDKQKIIDDYIVAMTYAYYQIATGVVLKNVNTSDFVQVSLAHAAEIKNFTNVDTGDSVSENCFFQVGNGDIVRTALGLAWDTSGHGPERSDAKLIYARTMDQYNGSVGDQPYSDCGVFVATVMRSSQADPKYPKRGTGVQLAYVRAHPEKYQVFDNFNSVGQLLPGDIFVFNNGNNGHTYIYTGEYKGGDGRTRNAASAAWHRHVPEASNVDFDQDGNHFSVVRLINNTGSL